VALSNHAAEKGVPFDQVEGDVSVAGGEEADDDMMLGNTLAQLRNMLAIGEGQQVIAEVYGIVQYVLHAEAGSVGHGLFEDYLSHAAPRSG
jgi:hypothetical protein